MAHKLTNISFEEYWNSSQGTVKDILTLKNISRDAWFKCFHDIFNISHSQRLYNSTKLLIEERVLELLSIVQTKNTASQLESYYENWQNYCKSIKTLDLLYHNYNILNDKKHKQSEEEKLYGHISLASLTRMTTRDLGLDIWKRKMILPLKDSLPKLLTDEINKLRCNTSTTTSTNIIVAIIHSFFEFQDSNNSQFKFYNIYFEEPFLNHSIEYFKCEASKFTKGCYLSEVLKLLEQEKIILHKLLPQITHPKVLNIFYQQVVIDNFNIILEEFETILKEERFNDILKIYELLLDDDHRLGSLAQSFGKHIENDGVEIITVLNPKQIHKHFIEELLKLYKQYRKIVKYFFYNKIQFKNAFDQAFTAIINFKPVENQSSKSPEYLSKYCDMLLNKSHKDICIHEINNSLSKSIRIFKYIDDKNVFQNIYQKQMAQRLLLKQSISMKLEEQMITSLKKAGGYELTSNLHQMLLDIKISEGLNAQFISEHGTTVDDLNISFFTNVLHIRAWPSGLTAKSSFVLPEPLKLYASNFENFYKDKFNGRKLTWLHHQSWGVLKLNYLQKTYKVTMQTIKISILLLFDDCDTLKYSEISDALQLTNDQFEKHINGLLECKLLLLDGDNVKLNLEFSYPNKKFSLPISAIKKKKQDCNRPKN